MNITIHDIQLSIKFCENSHSKNDKYNFFYNNGKAIWRNHEAHESYFSLCI